MKMKIIIKDRIGMQAKYTPNLLVDSEKKKKTMECERSTSCFSHILFSLARVPCREHGMPMVQ